MENLNDVYERKRLEMFNIQQEISKNAYKSCPTCNNNQDLVMYRHLYNHSAQLFKPIKNYVWYWDYEFRCNNGHRWRFIKGEKSLLHD